MLMKVVWSFDLSLHTLTDKWGSGNSSIAIVFSLVSFSCQTQGREEWASERGSKGEKKSELSSRVACNIAPRWVTLSHSSTLVVFAGVHWNFVCISWGMVTFSFHHIHFSRRFIIVFDSTRFTLSVFPFYRFQSSNEYRNSNPGPVRTIAARNCVEDHRLSSGIGAHS